MSLGAFTHRLRELRSDDERRAFAEGFCTTLSARTNGVLKGHIPLTYLRASRATGVFDRKGRMIAGYVVGSSLPLRLLEFVPEEARRSLTPPSDGSWADCCELTCFWRTKEVSPVFMALRVWPRAISEAIRTRKRFLLGHNQSHRLDALYARARGLTLYAGPSVANLPSRLSAYELRGLWALALRLIAGETLRRLFKRRAKEALL